MLTWTHQVYQVVSTGRRYSHPQKAIPSKRHQKATKPAPTEKATKLNTRHVLKWHVTCFNDTWRVLMTRDVFWWHVFDTPKKQQSWIHVTCIQHKSRVLYTRHDKSRVLYTRHEYLVWWLFPWVPVWWLLGVILRVKHVMCHQNMSHVIKTRDVYCIHTVYNKNSKSAV